MIDHLKAKRPLKQEPKDEQSQPKIKQEPENEFDDKDVDEGGEH